MPSRMDVQCALNAQLDIWWQASSWERGLPLDAEDPMKKEREAGGRRKRSIDTFELWRQFWRSHPRLKEGGNGVGRPVGKRKRIQETADHEASKPKQAANFMRNCSVRNFSGWGSRRRFRLETGRLLKISNLIGLLLLVISR